MPSPILMESRMGRPKPGLSLSTLNTRSGFSSTSRCLFGAPDAKQATDFVKEVELKNALNFGKRYNFDIVTGEPFPHPKKMKMSEIVNDSDEESGADDNAGYNWTETYGQDYMAVCNKHSRTRYRRANEWLTKSEELDVYYDFHNRFVKQLNVLILEKEINEHYVMSNKDINECIDLARYTQ